VENWSYSGSYTKEEYSAKQKEVQDVFTKAFTEGRENGSPQSSETDAAFSTAPGEQSSPEFEPKIEEID
jgi:hypothetical protein